MKLSEVLKGIEEIEVRGDLEIDVPSIAYDSRKVENGGMFVAIVGFKMDGHNYIESAIIFESTSLSSIVFAYS